MPSPARVTTGFGTGQPKQERRFPFALRGGPHEVWTRAFRLHSAKLGFSQPAVYCCRVLARHPYRYGADNGKVFGK